MTERAALLVGGPRGGQWLSNDGSHLVVYEAAVLRDFADTSDPVGAVMREAATHVYVWFPVKIEGREQWFWVHEPLARQGPGVVFTELLTGYHPAWVPAK